MSNDPSLADRFVLVMAEIEREIPMVIWKFTANNACDGAAIQSQQQSALL